MIISSGIPISPYYVFLGDILRQYAITRINLVYEENLLNMLNIVVFDSKHALIFRPGKSLTVYSSLSAPDLFVVASLNL